MFSGIIEELGTLRRLSLDGTIEIEAAFSAELAVGESVAVNGTCLTVVQAERDWWAADVVAETLACTNLGERAPGDRVNLERSLRLADRVSGHLVQGHVDGLGTVIAGAPEVVVAMPAPLARYVVPKGSIAVDGVSLTVVQVFADRFTVAVVLYTAQVTTLGALTPGARVNLEVDVLAKYVERLIAPAGIGAPSNDEPG